MKVEKAKRFSQRETISFGPSRAKASTESRSTPYGNKPLSDDSAPTSQEIGIDLLNGCQLPGGWHCEDGFVEKYTTCGNFVAITSSSTTSCHELEHILRPQRMEYLTKDRDSYDGSQHHHDRWKKKGTTSTDV